MNQSHSRTLFAEPDRSNTPVTAEIRSNARGAISREPGKSSAGERGPGGASSSRGFAESVYEKLSVPPREYMTLKGPSSAAVELRPSAGRLYSVPMNGQEDHKTRELALSKSYRAITLETSDSKRVHALHLAGNAKRPHVLFAKEFEYHALFSYVQSEIARGEGRESPKFITTGGFYLRAQLDAFREQNISGPVVVFPWKSPRSRAERLNLGMNIRHEFTHARGGGEFTARIAEWQYLKRNGIPVDDLKPLQIVRELERLHSLGVYSEEHLHGAYDEFRASSTPSESTDFLADLTRRARWKSFVCRIGTLFGRKGEAFGSSESRYLDRLAHEASKA